jgi:hypothetical protein
MITADGMSCYANSCQKLETEKASQNKTNVIDQTKSKKKVEWQKNLFQEKRGTSRIFFYRRPSDGIFAYRPPCRVPRLWTLSKARDPG